MTDKKTCFIIMPISTPEIHISKYDGDKEHFTHVLSELIIPSVEKAGMIAIPPKAKGSDLIHAEIVKNLEIADLVLCDLSILNPNVFFEFGIRTALNKPVCVIKDNITGEIPFDTGIINYLEYNSDMRSWIVKPEIRKLSEHISESFSRSEGKSNLWKYFGLRINAVPESTSSDSDKFSLIMNHMESLRNEITHFKGDQSDLNKIPDKNRVSFVNKDNNLSAILNGISDFNSNFQSEIIFESDRIVLTPKKTLSHSVEDELSDLSQKLKIPISVNFGNGGVTFLPFN